MAGRYGLVYSLVDFIERSMTKRKSEQEAAPFHQRVLNFLKALGAAEEDNSFVTLIFQTGGALSVYYKGVVLLQCKPQTQHMRLIVREDAPEDHRANLLSQVRNDPILFKEQIEAYPGYLQWRCGSDELDFIARFVQELPAETQSDVVNGADHPRNFPGDVREAALQAFLREGGYCRGVGRKRHKITTERIEFDHVLPFAKGGASSLRNVEVLCAECNRRKRDRAI